MVSSIDFRPVLALAVLVVGVGAAVVVLIRIQGRVERLERRYAQMQWMLQKVSAAASIRQPTNTSQHQAGEAPASVSGAGVRRESDPDTATSEPSVSSFVSTSPNSVREESAAMPMAASAGLQDPPYSSELALDLFRRWCVEGKRAQSSSRFDVASLLYLRAEPNAQYGGAKRHVLADAPQAAEFVRISAKDAPEALVFPDPDAHFSPVMAHLFPGLSRTAFEQTESLIGIAPVTVRRRDNAEWEVV